MKPYTPCAPHTFKQNSVYLVPAGLFIQVLFMLLFLASPALAAEALLTSDKPSSNTHFSSMEAERIACFDRLWSNNQEDVWFYDENGQQVVPASSLEWLVVRLMNKPMQVDALATAAIDSFPTETFNNPAPSFESFNANYGEYFSHFLQDPELAPAMTAYRLRLDMPKKVFQDLIAKLQQDPQVMYAHPAWKIAEQLYAPLESIDVTWKTSASSQQRNALLKAIGAVKADAGLVSNRQKVTIVPCQQSVWQAANLLAEDIRVVQARPLLMPLLPPVGVEFSLSMNGATPGSQIPFTFEIRFTDKVKIESSTIANLSLKPRGIFHNLYDIRYDVPLSSIDLNRSPIRISGQIKIYATGEYTLPPIPVYYSDNDGAKTKIRLLKTAAIPVRIAAMIPETQQGFELLVGQLDPMPTIDASAATKTKYRYAVLILAGMALIGLAGATAVLLRRSYRKQIVPPENHTLIRKHAAAIEAVSIAQQHPGLTEIAALGMALKRYLATFSGLDEKNHGGSHIAFFNRIEDALPSASRLPAAEVLSIIDHVLARGDQAAIPATLTEQTLRLIEELQAADETPLDCSEKY